MTTTGGPPAALIEEERTLPSLRSNTNHSVNDPHCASTALGPDLGGDRATDCQSEHRGLETKKSISVTITSRAALRACAGPIGPRGPSDQGTRCTTCDHARYADTDNPWIRHRHKWPRHPPIQQGPAQSDARARDKIERDMAHCTGSGRGEQHWIPRARCKQPDDRCRQTRHRRRAEQRVGAKLVGAYIATHPAKASAMSASGASAPRIAAAPTARTLSSRTATATTARPTTTRVSGSMRVGFRTPSAYSSRARTVRSIP